jgi:hypothetical protein
MIAKGDGFYLGRWFGGDCCLYAKGRCLYAKGRMAMQALDSLLPDIRRSRLIKVKVMSIFLC